LVILIAVIGFAFDTYELLMFPLIARPAVAELLQLPPSHDLVRDWTGNMLWITALAGGIFGLLGGWLTDRLGRKTVLTGSIALYSFSPVLAALSTSLGAFIFFRSTTFIGVCVEFVAAITWLAELFPDKKQKELVLGTTQAFASIGGLLVTGANKLVTDLSSTLPALPISEPFDSHASWRYTLITGLLPAIPIALLLPFVPESGPWKARRQSGTLKRPSLGQLFSPELRRTTLVTAGLSACAYAIAFGALQLTPTFIAPGLPDLAEQRASLKPLQSEAAKLNQQLDELNPGFLQACSDVTGLRELAGKRAKARQTLNAVRKAAAATNLPPEQKTMLLTRVGSLTNRLNELDLELAKLTAEKPDAKKALIDREKIFGQLAANRAKQDGPDKLVKDKGTLVQAWQETGGLLGRIALAILVVTTLPRRTILRLFQVPGVVLIPLTYIYFFRNDPDAFKWGIGICGFLTVAQFSYFGEYLPKVFPIHLRGTGGSFATNVGGRMIGTSAALITTRVVAPNLPGSTFEQVALGAAIVGTAVFVVACGLSFLLPEPTTENAE
jgi:MFS family permease